MAAQVRNHVLTKLLADSLTGTARTLVLACASPVASCQPDTVKTLRCGPNQWV